MRDVKFSSCVCMRDWTSVANIDGTFAFARNYNANLLKFLLHSTTRAHIEEDVFVFCLTVYPDIFVIVLEIKREGGDARREKRTGRFRDRKSVV